MCRLHGAGDVRSGQRGEDERLQQGDQGLEQEDEDRQREGARGVDQPDRQAQQVPRCEREDRQQQVAGEHVPEEPHPERERLEDEEPEQLDRDQDDVDRRGHARRDHVPEVTPGPLVLDAQVQVEEVDDEYQRPHEADPGRDRELEERDQLHHVHDVDEEEQRYEQRQVGVAFPAQRRAEDLVAYAQDRYLAEVLHAPRDQFGRAERQPEEHDHHERGQDRQEHRLGEAERSDGEERLPFEVLQARSWESAPAEDVAAAAREYPDVTGHRSSPFALPREEGRVTAPCLPYR